MNKKILEKKMKELPINIGFASLALLFGLAERSGVAISEILAGPSRGLGKSYSRINELRTFWDYYDELKDMHENSARTILWRLHRKGLVKKSVSKKKNYYQLTIRGLKIIKNIRDEKNIENAWDGKWRMIMFDIPEKERGKRNWLRSQLLFLEYKPIQKSVFVGKIPIDEDFWNDIAEHNLNGYIRLLTIGEIDDDRILEP